MPRNGKPILCKSKSGLSAELAKNTIRNISHSLVPRWCQTLVAIGIEAIPTLAEMSYSFIQGMNQKNWEKLQTALLAPTLKFHTD